MRLNLGFFLAGVLASTGAVFSVTLSPGASLTVSRVDPSDGSLAGATEWVQNSSFIASNSTGPDTFYQGRFLSQAIKQSNDGALAFHYQFTSTGQTPIGLQSFTIMSFGGIAADIIYIAPADESINASRSTDGRAITVRFQNGPNASIVIRTNALSSDTSAISALSLIDPGGPGAPPFDLTATANVVAPAEVQGAVPEPSCTAALGVGVIALAIRHRLRRC